MPFIRLTVADPNLTTERQRSLAEEFTRLVDRDLDKDPEDTVVQVNVVPERQWYIGGRAPDGGGVHVEVSITADTNTDDQKAAFLRDAHAAVAAHVPAPASAIYVALYEVDGHAYGFNGVSQHAHATLDPGRRD